MVQAVSLASIDHSWATVQQGGTEIVAFLSHMWEKSLQETKCRPSEDLGFADCTIIMLITVMVLCMTE